MGKKTFVQRVARQLQELAFKDFGYKPSYMVCLHLAEAPSEHRISADSDAEAQRLFAANRATFASYRGAPNA
ncbi:hypothetical protein FJV41_31280 [Myxococcus llanfairpwllgwyngyllgogerychwyrndrobwllllantysiliogogogochensis]|uniref:Uncharacterized protein n=1 Tax=Myxococcus llanfairpwllgwyngyllgogerychwyrndrobwllllantysiliogogogochensis TaxID=2590453 RepID=A0A540WSK9_9BACT|nr:hypothetical protein [Myxococcus llanfairpwllgwyngyllgogerychwyrndrobwllllantysiliogogogochensis]TQF12011.1 hypothetical protein FJV41_31280 [Myxococcus llanfairpwllgwyngyllgogerychwyrndrobwllllantysiliogogogochensis]